jgi:alpha-ketoglutarate-dependent taurine dioxygenase
MRSVPLSDALGAQLVDFDVKRPRREAEQAELRALFSEHHLLLVRGQEVTEADQNRFVGHFGPLHVVQSTGAIETYVSNRDDRMVGTGTTRLLWHTDGAYGPRPGIATSLWAQDVEADVPPTMFTNTVRALERLPADLRTRIEPLHALHMKDSYVERTDRRWRVEEIPADAQPGRFPTYEHPLVYPLPHIDAKALFVSELQTSHIVELARDEGEALLQDLLARLYAEDNVYTHTWQPNDLIIWDNIALQHCRPREMGTPRRHLRRQSVDGWYTGDCVLEWTETVVRYDGIIPEAVGR